MEKPGAVLCFGGWRVSLGVLSPAWGTPHFMETSTYG